jgi:hypothetical protein
VIGNRLVGSAVTSALKAAGARSMTAINAMPEIAQVQRAMLFSPTACGRGACSSMGVTGSLSIYDKSTPTPTWRLLPEEPPENISSPTTTDASLLHDRFLVVIFLLINGCKRALQKNF